MSVTLPVKWKPEKSIAIDMLVSAPESSIQAVADKAGVTTATIRNWFKDPEFVEVYYQKYMVTFGARLPNVLNSMVREAEAGNVQAGRLVLEHSGKLIKRVEVDNHQSPFEKFLNTQIPTEAEVIEDIEEVQVFPQRPVVPENPVQIKLDEKKRAKKNKKRREARRWRERAEAVGVAMPKQGRQTPRQRKEWQEKVEKREKALNIKVL
jgi:AcrR family transcriptional regulator